MEMENSQLKADSTRKLTTGHNIKLVLAQGVKGESWKELSDEIFFFDPGEILVVPRVSYTQASPLVVVVVQSWN